MGDFYLDLRSSPRRNLSLHSVKEALRWTSDTVVSSFITDEYTLVVARTDGTDLWSPAVLNIGAAQIVVALAGRVALEPALWRAGESSPSRGGLACRALTEVYVNEGVAGIQKLNGNFCLILIDQVKRSIHVVTDQAGLQIAYTGVSTENALTLCSHPDVLAAALDLSQQFDRVSLGEFIASGRLSFPHTYYSGIKALDAGTIFTFAHNERQWHLTTLRYFNLTPNFGPGATIKDLSDQLASALQQAVKLRTLPIFGRLGLAMSGGMDSRAILCCIPDASRVQGFVLVDEENPESAAAQAIARACGVDFQVIKRPFDYYGSAAADGARFGGGTGALASNHFLGIRTWLSDHRISNVLTGCYCDYLFKALALNTRETRILRREILAPTTAEFYRPIFRETTRLEDAVTARLQERLPANGAPKMTDEAFFEIEKSRTFPFAYEGDCAQRVIGQRALPWFAPMSDRGLLEVYRQIPSRLKLNGDLFREMLRKVCSRAVLDVPNSNTGASITAGLSARSFHRYKSALLNRVARHRSRGLASRGSWPNWEYYIERSLLIRSQWEDSSDTENEILEAIVDGDLIKLPPHAFRGKHVELFQRIWTLKLWLRYRVGSAVRPVNTIAEHAS